MGSNKKGQKRNQQPKNSRRVRTKSAKEVRIESKGESRQDTRGESRKEPKREPRREFNKESKKETRKETRKETARGSRRVVKKATNPAEQARSCERDESLESVEQTYARVTFREVGGDQAGQRLDNFLFSRLKGVPKSKVYRIIRKGELRVNGKRAKVDYRLQADDKIRIPPLRVSERTHTLPPKTLLAEKLPLDHIIIYESKALLVINKPAGIAVHSGSGVQWGVIEALRELRSDLEFIELVHRLDRETSGVLLLAKKRSVLKALHQALAGSDLDKRYWALLSGKLPKRRTTVDLPLDKNVYRGGERMVQVSRDGKPAVTHVELLQRCILESIGGDEYGNGANSEIKDLSWVEVTLETGRTHQIRVHSQYLGHPIVGDEKYGNSGYNGCFKANYGTDRMWLHAAQLTIPKSVAKEVLNLPEALTFKADLSSELMEILDKITVE